MVVSNKRASGMFTACATDRVEVRRRERARDERRVHYTVQRHAGASGVPLTVAGMSIASVVDDRATRPNR